MKNTHCSVPACPWPAFPARDDDGRRVREPSSKQLCLTHRQMADGRLGSRFSSHQPTELALQASVYYSQDVLIAGET
jgi:hypothetical protein